MYSNYSKRKVYPPNFTEILLKVNILNESDLDIKKNPRHHWKYYVYKICNTLSDALIHLGVNEGKSCDELFDSLKNKAIVSLLELCKKYENEVRESIIRISNNEDCFSKKNVQNQASHPLHYEFEIISESPKHDKAYVFTEEDKQLLISFKIFNRLQIKSNILNKIDKENLKRTLVETIFRNLAKGKIIKEDYKYKERIWDFESKSSLKNVLQILKKMHLQNQLLYS